MSGKTGNVFGIGSNTGVITVAGTLNRSTTSSYTLTVRATDPSDNYDSATVTITVTAPTLPSVGAPVGLSASSAMLTSVHLDWTAETGATKYRVQYRQGNAGSWSTASSSVSGTSYTVGNLACGASYQFQVAAYGNGTTHKAAWGSYSSTVSHDTLDCLTAPPALTGVTTSSSRSSIQVNWTGLTGASKYRLEYRRGTSGGWTLETDTDTTPGNRVSGLSCNRQYQFRLAAYGDGTVYLAQWGANTDTVSASTSSCQKPTFDPATHSFDVHDFGPVGTPVGTVTATDPTPNETLTYSITAGNNHDKFAIDGSTGAITVKNALNVDPKDASYSLTVKVTDGHNQTATATVNITPTQGFTVSFKANSYAAAEGESATVTVHVNPTPGQDFSVPLAVTHQGGATVDDYSGWPSSVTLASGATSQDITVAVADDDFNDDGESLALSFGTLPSGFHLGETATATLTIVDTDATIHSWDINLQQYEGLRPGAGAEDNVVDLRMSFVCNQQAPPQPSHCPFEPGTITFKVEAHCTDQPQNCTEAARPGVATHRVDFGGPRKPFAVISGHSHQEIQLKIRFGSYDNEVVPIVLRQEGISVPLATVNFRIKRP